MATRRETDSLGEVAVPADALWGAQTQRALNHFRIGDQRFPPMFIRQFARVKKAAALANAELGTLDAERADGIVRACDEIIDGEHADQFPVGVWQTGSGTQTHMNLNEVIANRANELAGQPRGSRAPVHPNDHVNRSQSSNDVFPTVMHLATLEALHTQLQPALTALRETLRTLSDRFADRLKSGRTHLMDATPVTLGQELGGYEAQLAYADEQLAAVWPALQCLAIGGSAVGTGLNTPPGWAATVTARISELTGFDCTPAPNRFMALAGHEALADCHGRLRVLATALFKMASDIRLMASGPRCGLGEVTLPANEPGSSIMPGKVNPTQVEALTMVVARVLGNDATVGFANSQGQFELNVYKPVLVYTVLESIGLLAEAMQSFNDHCLRGLTTNDARLDAYVDNSLMLVTALTPHLGYDKAAEIAKRAFEQDCSLRQAAVELGALSPEEFDRLVVPANMVLPKGLPKTS